MIPEPVSKTQVLTYEAPNVLLQSSNGVTQIREGRMVQIEHTTTRSFSPTKISKKEFRHGALSRFRFGGHTVNVLCDTAIYNGQKLNESSPTASEYMGAIGRKVTLYFRCTRVNPDLALKHYQESGELWQCVEISITLPDFKDDQ